MTVCFCGCGQLAQDRHHILTQQVIRREARSRGVDPEPWLTDPRNLVPVSRQSHADHHARGAPFALSMLPDAVFEFAVELLGAGPAFVWLGRTYAGSDLRLDALSGEAEAAA